LMSWNMYYLHLAVVNFTIHLPHFCVSSSVYILHFPKASESNAADLGTLLTCWFTADYFICYLYQILYLLPDYLDFNAKIHLHSLESTAVKASGGGGDDEEE
ncbi:hypothetical protein ACJX0J_006850, partial [Zea mays]